jgi:hypothetical protein
MQAVLKGLHSTDVADVETYQPEREDNFGLVLRAMVGPRAMQLYAGEVDSHALELGKESGSDCGCK